MGEVAGLGGNTSMDEDGKGKQENQGKEDGKAVGQVEEFHGPWFIDYYDPQWAHVELDESEGNGKSGGGDKGGDKAHAPHTPRGRVT